MGRATNELGYPPRALLVRQLSRIACNIPHFLYLQNVIKNRDCCTCDMAVNDLSCTPRINIVSQIPLLLITLTITPNTPPTYLHCFLAHQSQILQVVHFAIWQYGITDGHEMTLERILYTSCLDRKS